MNNRTMSPTSPGYPIHFASDYTLRVERGGDGSDYIIVTPPAPAPSFAMVLDQATVFGDGIAGLARVTRRLAIAEDGR